MKKWKISSEIVYLIGTVILALATAMLTAADFGLSMVVAPAYIVSLKFDFLTFGQAEYIVQGLLFVVFCMVVIVVSLLLLHKIEGIGPGTVVLVGCNGMLIGWYGKWFDRKFEAEPTWKRLAGKFEL